MSTPTARSLLSSIFAMLVLFSSAAPGQAPATDELTRLQQENQQLRAENQRLRNLLIQGEPAAPTAPRSAPVTPATAPTTVPTVPGVAQPNALYHWLTLSSSKRHNSICRYFKNSNGRPCTAAEGTACKICGG